MMAKQDFGHRFLYAEDLIADGRYQSPILVIEEIIRPGTLESADGKMIEKPTMRFVGREKMLVLNITNQQVVPLATKQSLYKSIGCQVKLEVRDVKSIGGGIEPAIRIVPPKGTLMRRKLKDRLGEPSVLPATEPPKEPDKKAKPKEQQELIDKTENTGN